VSHQCPAVFCFWDSLANFSQVDIKLAVFLFPSPK
jgi:hypothetical protein